MHAASRAKEEIPPDVVAVSNLNKDGEYFYPALDLLMQYNVVVTTLVTAGRLVSATVPSTHFTFVFIDEAGQVRKGRFPPHFLHEIFSLKPSLSNFCFDTIP